MTAPPNGAAFRRGARRDALAQNGRCSAALPPDLRPLAQQVLTGWAALPADPLGQVWGHFDAHGWNMAFGPEAKRLTGIHDFGAAVLAPCTAI